jgi:hypothetical protein
VIGTAISPSSELMVDSLEQRAVKQFSFRFQFDNDNYPAIGAKNMTFCMKKTISSSTKSVWNAVKP